MRRIGLVLLLAGMALQGRAAAREGAGPVVLITIDTWRADYWGKAGADKVSTPAIDALAEDGAWFETAYCQVPLTPPSHASILTGTYPATHGVRDFTSGPVSQGATSLASILKRHGYETAAFVSALVLDSVWGLDRGFDLYDDAFDAQDARGASPGNVQRSAEETTDRVLRWMEGREAGEAYFLWVHYFDPHHDYDPPQPFRSRYASDPYAGEVAYVDSQIARLTEALRERKQYDASLIVVTSDHGESLGEHGEPNHGLLLYETTTRIPLVFKLPSGLGVNGRRVEAVAETVDILPTILQVLGIRPRQDWGIEGKGRLGAILGKPDRRAALYAETLYPLKTFGWSPLYAYREGRYKFIDAPRPELYDLDEDPGELENLYPERSALGEQLRNRLLALRSKIEASGQTGRGGEIDTQAVERLSALGYAALSQPVPVEGSREDLADPKDMLPVYREIVSAMDASEAGQAQRAVRIFEKVARKHPELFIVQYSIGTQHLKLGRPQKALEALDAARELNPNYDSIDLNRARALAMLGRVQEGIETLRGLIERNPGHPAARHRLGAQLRLARRPLQAADVYREILERRPGDSLAVKFLGINLVEGKRFEEGLKYIEQYLDSHPLDALTANFRGIALDNLGRREEAAQTYLQALELKPDYGQARLNLAFSLLRQGRKREAQNTFQPLCKSHPRLCRQYRRFFE